MGVPGRPKVSDEIEKRIIDTFVAHPDWSLRRIAKEVREISHLTVMRVLRKHKLWVSS
jgi:hypothetical protein